MDNSRQPKSGVGCAVPKVWIERMNALAAMPESHAAGDALAELAFILQSLGPVADRLATRAVIVQYEADIADPARTRAGTSLASTSGPLPRFLPARDILRINFNMHALVPAEAVPSRLARSMRLPTDDHLSSALPYAPSLRAALELVVRYGDAVLPWYHRRLEPAGDHVRIVYGPIVPLGRIEPLANEVALMTIYRIVEMFVGDEVAGARLNFARQTASQTAVLADRFLCPIGFGGSENYLVIPKAWLARISPYHDAGLWPEGVAHCEADIRMLQDAPLISRVRAHCRARLDQRKISGLCDTAAALGMSERSLVRALAAAGVTHHQLFEAERKARAGLLLANAQHSLADIAEMLGFSDQSGFGRKCRAWFGDSPGRVRQQLIGKQP